MSEQSTGPEHLQRVVLLVLCAPIAALALAMLFSGMIPLEQVVLDRILIGYCLALLAFLSGARLGAMLVAGAEAGKGVWLVVAAPLLALPVIALPFTFATALLIVGFGAQGAWDSWSGFKGSLSRKYAANRLLMTWIIAALLIAILILHGMGNT